MKSTLILFVVSTLTLISSLKAYACDCGKHTLQQSVKSTKLVLVGRFIQGKQISEFSEKNTPTLYYTGKFVVANVLKGSDIKAGDTLQVTTDHTNCSVLYKNETDYIFFSEGEEVQSSICTYTRALSDEDGKKVYKRTKRLLRKRLVRL